MFLLENYIVRDIPMKQSKLLFQLFSLGDPYCPILGNYLIHVFLAYILIKLAWFANKNAILDINNPGDLK